MSEDALFRWFGGIETFLINAVDAKNLDFPIDNPLAHRLNDFPVFKIVEMCCPRGKKQDGNAPIAENQQLHISVQDRTEPFLVLSFHDTCRRCAYHISCWLGDLTLSVFPVSTLHIRPDSGASHPAQKVF